MAEPVLTINNPEDLFSIIAEAHDLGRQIIPLFGSGISVDAGFPVAAHLCDYLVRLHWWLKLKNKGSVDAFLRGHPWPSRHDLNADLLSESDIRHNFEKRLRREEFNLNREAIFDELRRDAPTAAFAVKTLFDEVTGERVLNDRPTMRDRFDRITGTIHGYTGYRSLLNFLCDRDGNLIDAFFDHFASHRHPSTTHQFVAFVVQLLRSRLILTTNFDTFVESALREEGLDPTVYEIARDGSVPSDQLLRNQQLALVKLHGGAYALRTGFDLDERLGQGALAEYRRYFHSDNQEYPPLVIALGYSGSDRRVMDILSTHLQGWGAKSREYKGGVSLAAAETRILWISRDGKPPALLTEITRPHVRTEKSSPVRIGAYRDARMFLHELYQRLTQQHPVSRHHYRAVTPLPRTPRSNLSLLEEPDKTKPAATMPVRDHLDRVPVEAMLADADEFRKELADSRGFIFCANVEGSGSSSLLAKACRTMDRTHMTLWIDAAELRSRASLIGVIQESLHPYDRHLNRVTRPLLFHDVDYVLREQVVRCAVQHCSPRTPDAWNRLYMRQGFEKDEKNTPLLQWVEDWEEGVALRWIANALRRGRYVLAIDSLGEFGRGHPASPLVRSDSAGEIHTDAAVGQQIDKIYAFFAKLLDKDRYDLGESKVLIALTRRGETDVACDALLKNAEMRQVRHFVMLPGKATRRSPCDKQVDGRTRGQAAVETYESWIGNQATPTTLVKAFVALIACFARRPRSYAFMVTMLTRVSNVTRKLEVADRLLEKLRDAYIGDGWLPRDPAKPVDDMDRARAALRLLTCHVPPAGAATEISADPSDGGNTGRPVEFLLHEEGGFYWMHQAIRDSVFEAAVNSSTKHPISLQLRRESVALLLDGMANFYYEDVYERSQDSAAFMEYMFHRLGSIEWEPNGTRRLKRCEWLIAAVETEKEKLLARGRLTVLLNHMRTYLSLLVQYAKPTSEAGQHEREYRELLVRLLAAYSEIFVACGHPHEALQYRLLQAEFLIENIKSPVPPSRQLPAMEQLSSSVGLTSLQESWNKPLIYEDADRIEDTISRLLATADALSGDLNPTLQGTVQISIARDKVRAFRAVVDAMTDLGIALTEPILFTRLPPPTEAHPAKAYWERPKDRFYRAAWGTMLYKRAAQHSGMLCDICASQQDVERRSRAKLRLMEHKLRLYGLHRFEYDEPPVIDGVASQTSASRSSDTCLDTKAVCSTVIKSLSAKDRRGLERIVEECEVATEELRSGPPASRRLRHKCYLYLSKARAQSLLGNRPRADVNFRRAQAALARSAGAAERTALGLSFMFQAESLLLWLEPDDKERSRILREVEMLLQRAKASMEDNGRSENRWRVFLSFLCARLEWERTQSSSPLDAQMISESLFAAMRHLVFAFTNTGMRSDRRIVLQRLYKQVRDEIGKLEADNKDPERPTTYVSNRLRIGLPASSQKSDEDFINRYSVTESWSQPAGGRPADGQTLGIDSESVLAKVEKLMKPGASAFGRPDGVLTDELSKPLPQPDAAVDSTSGRSSESPTDSVGRGKRAKKADHL